MGVHPLDVDTAYLNGAFGECAFMELPESLYMILEDKKKILNHFLKNKRMVENFIKFF